jgi:CRP/FNR family transcriptional regulator
MPPADGSLVHLPTTTRCGECGLWRRCLGESGRSDALLALARLIGTRAPLDAGEVLYHQGERMRSVYLVQSGSLKSVAVFANGTEQVLAFHGPGSWIGFDGVGEARHSCRVEALERTRLCALQWTAAQELALRNPMVQRRLFEAIGSEALATQRHMEMMACPAPRRVARFLMEQSLCRQRIGLDPLAYELSMCREDIASYLGLAEETTCRQFTRLQEDGALRVDRRLVRILDLERLAQLGGCSRSWAALTEAVGTEAIGRTDLRKAC